MVFSVNSLTFFFSSPSLSALDCLLVSSFFFSVNSKPRPSLNLANSCSAAIKSCDSLPTVCCNSSYCRNSASYCCLIFASSWETFVRFSTIFAKSASISALFCDKSVTAGLILLNFSSIVSTSAVFCFRVCSLRASSFSSNDVLSLIMAIGAARFEGAVEKFEGIAGTGGAPNAIKS